MLWLASWLLAGLVMDLIVSNHARRTERWYGPWHLAASIIVGPMFLAVMLLLIPIMLVWRRG